MGAELKSATSVGEHMEREQRAREALTFEKVCEMEPKIKQLFNLARMIGKKPERSFCANFVWYNLFKPRLHEAVGWGRKTGKNDLLNTMAAYDIAYHTVYNELPDCDGCACF